VSSGAQLAAGNDSEATIIVVASGHPRGLFQFTGPPTVMVTRQQKQVDGAVLPHSDFCACRYFSSVRQLLTS